MHRLGLAGEVCHGDALRRLRRNLDRLSYFGEDASLAAYFQDAPGVYQMRFVPIPAELDRSDLRFAVESEKDWDNVQMICETVSNDETQWQSLATIVLGNPAMLASMEGCNS